MLYLERVGLNIKTMHPIQLQETRRAFYGAAGQMLILLRDDLSELPEEEAISKLDSMIIQVEAFWMNQIKPNQKK
uniref:hypothetical protein n=2 Tax=Runella zeae TaxID=94255 RepID=UPI0004900C72|nr:hypothetical protein [Runella zeae]